MNEIIKNNIFLKTRARSFGYILIILSAAFFALTHVIGKPLLESGEIEINPVALTVAIYFINGLFFTPLTKKSIPISKIGIKNIIIIAAIGIAEVSALITYFYGLGSSTAINASIFSNGEIIFSLLIAVIIFKEKLKKSEFGPVMMIIFGMMLLPLGYEFYENDMTLSPILVGDILIIFSGLLYAIDVNLCKYVSDKISSYRITQLVSFSAGGFALFIMLYFQLPFNINIEQVAPITLIALVGTGIATLFFLMALKMIGAVRTILIYSSTAVFGIIFSTIILGEIMTIPNVISIVSVMAGIYLLRKKFNENEKPNENKLPNVGKLESLNV